MQKEMCYITYVVRNVIVFVNIVNITTCIWTMYTREKNEIIRIAYEGIFVLSMDCARSGPEVVLSLLRFWKQCCFNGEYMHVKSVDLKVFSVIYKLYMGSL